LIEIIRAAIAADRALSPRWGGHKHAAMKKLVLLEIRTKMGGIISERRVLWLHEVVVRLRARYQFGLRGV